MATAASLFFTSYELAKHHLPRVAPSLGTDSWAPALHMLSASSGEVVRRERNALSNSLPERAV